MRVTEIRRYPVKSMAGERLNAVEVDCRGLAGDRWWAVVDDEGKLASGKNGQRFRRRDAVFDHRSETVDGEVIVHALDSHWLAGDPELDRALCARMGAPVRLRQEARMPHQDAGQVSLVGSASLEWCRKRLGVDGDARRLRPNLVVETEEPFEEETWTGWVQVGVVRLAVVESIVRCRMVDIAQEGLPEQPGWLKALGRERDLCLGLYLDVVAPGRIEVGDRVEARARR